MRRIQVHVDGESDSRAEAEARRRGVSKAALIRSTLAREMGGEPAAEPDPWQAIIGWLDDDPVADVDALIYSTPG